MKSTSFIQRASLPRNVTATSYIEFFVEFTYPGLQCGLRKLQLTPLCSGLHFNHICMFWSIIEVRFKNLYHEEIIKIQTFH